MRSNPVRNLLPVALSINKAKQVTDIKKKKTQNKLYFLLYINNKSKKTTLCCILTSACVGAAATLITDQKSPTLPLLSLTFTCWTGHKSKIHY